MTGILYLRQGLRPAPDAKPASPLPAGELTAHFYVATDDEPEAGAAAADFCRLHGLEFVEYACLPQPIAPAQIAQHESEHAVAYERARREGLAVVLSWVTGPG